LRQGIPGFSAVAKIKAISANDLAEGEVEIFFDILFFIKIKINQKIINAISTFSSAGD